jgi:hypothetical protein
MGAPGKPNQLRLGFLTAIEVGDKGYVGGLLVTNAGGRPLEFQCTLPVKPNPTQELLYGPTLVPFVLGELIGGTLVERAGVKPQVILTDREQILELRNHLEMPVALVIKNDKSAKQDEASGEAVKEIRLGRQIIRIHSAHESDEQSLLEDGKQIPADADLSEPFDRVREALQETLRAGGVR